MFYSEWTRGVNVSVNICGSVMDWWTVQGISKDWWWKMKPYHCTAMILLYRLKHKEEQRDNLK